MRFFMVYPNQWATGNKPIGIATLAAVLKGAGHAFTLFDFTQFDCGAVGDRLVGEMSLEFRRVRNLERLPVRRRVSREEALQRLVEEIEAFRPDVIGLSVLSDDYPLGLEALRFVRRRLDVPTIVGGVHATVDPEGVMREPCVDMVCVGEGEGAIADLAERFDRGEDLSTIDNLWVKTPKGIVQNCVRPLIQNLDALPYPDWTIYPETAFYKPFDGYVYKYGDFELSRGCPYTCSYCINVELQQLYKGRGNYHREKSIARVIEEVSWFQRHYGIEFLKFWDETFLLMSLERLEALAEAYSRTIGLPFAIETTASSVTPRTAPLLKQFGCATASLGLETGNVDLRKGILDKNIDNAAYEQAYRLLSEHRIRGVSFNMIGLPFERREDIFDTIRINKALRTEAQAVGIFYPYKGTPIRTFCESKGLLDKDFEFTLLAQPTANFVTYTRGVGSVLKLSDVTRDELVQLRDLFAYYVEAPEWLWPLIDECGKDTPQSRTLNAVMFQCLSLKKYGDRTHLPRANGRSRLRAALPGWLEPFFAACEADPAWAAEMRPRLQALWDARPSEAGAPEPALASASVSREAEEEAFNQGGRLDPSRLNLIRKDMRDLAKQDVSKVFTDTRREAA